MKQEEHSTPLNETAQTFQIVTLGCRTNQYESQAYRDQLESLGLRQVGKGEHADVCIVNTCTVTEQADKSSRYEVRQLAKHNPGTRLVVTGCSAERQPEALLQISGVTKIVPNRNKEKLVAELFPDLEVPEFAIQQFEAHTRAFVKVQDGCNSYCTYCIIPYVRGRSRSRSLPDIVAEVQQLVSNGYKEIVLTGINIGDFDGNPAEGEKPIRLADLVRTIDAVPGVERLRLSSIDPDEVDDDLMDAILSGKNCCHSLHIVLQAGSNVILKRMNRKYTRQIFIDSITRLLAACPDFTFTTDIIVGFPGETEADLQETLAVMKEVQFAKVHMFPYSERPRTRAAILPNKVPADVINERKQRVLRQAEEYAFALRERFVGEQMRVLTESIDPSRPNEIFGHTDNFLPVWIPRYNLEPNQFVVVNLVANTAEGLKGTPISLPIIKSPCCQKLI